MFNKSIYITVASLAMFFALILIGCKKQEYELPKPKDGLQNDAIKRTLGPNIAGEPIEFAYAMALLPNQGKLVSAKVEATIAGGTGTYLDNNSYHTDASGMDVPVEIGLPSETKGAVTTITFGKDTSAATLRYYYIIPEDAKGQTVSFKFSATSSNGQTITYDLGPYTISKMDMVRGLNLKNGDRAYISIEDMAVYNEEEASANPAKIDLVYLYRNISGKAFNHALVSPGADPVYLPDVALPAGANRSTKLRKEFNLQDYNLAALQYGIYIDDLDFQKIDLTESPNYGINLKAESGAWVETSDGKYKAYIYFNSVNNGSASAIISIKRYAL
jgi:hypothetical protein